MSDRDLIDAVARKTGEDSHEIRRRGFVLTGPDDAGPDLEPECLLDVLLVDLRKRARSTGTQCSGTVASGRRSTRAHSRPAGRPRPRRWPEPRSRRPERRDLLTDG